MKTSRRAFLAALVGLPVILRAQDPSGPEVSVAVPPLEFDPENQCRIIRWNRVTAQEAVNYMAEGLAHGWRPYEQEGQKIFYTYGSADYSFEGFECYMLAPGFDPDKPWASTVVDFTKKRREDFRYTGLV